MTREESLAVLGHAAPWSGDATADAATAGATRRAMVGRAPLPGELRTRVLEAVPPFAFLAMPEQDL
jgi:hypothetical protein